MKLRPYVKRKIAIKKMREEDRIKKEKKENYPKKEMETERFF